MPSILLVLLMAQPPTVAFDGPSVRDSWFERRAEAVMAEQLSQGGFAVRRSGALTPPGPNDLVVTLRSKPSRVEAGRTTVTLSVKTKGARKVEGSVKGPASDLERLVAALSRRVAGPNTVAAAVGAPRPLPFLVHRELGRAEVRLENGRLRQAMLAYDRAGQRAKVDPVPAAIEGRRRAFQRLVHAGQTQLGDRTTLAAATAERAAIETRRRNRKEAIRAWKSFLRYTDRHAERWTLRGRLSPGARLHTALGRYALASNGRIWRLDARAGVVESVRKGEGMVALLGDEALHMKDGVLSRQDRGGAIRWRRRLPIEGPRRVLATSGFIGVLGDRRVVWADAGLGHLGQISRGTPPLASSAGGVLVWIPPRTDGAEGQVALLRPGKSTPTWRKGAPPVQAALLTRDRVVLHTDQGLQLLRTSDGSMAWPIRKWPHDIRWLHASGRYATYVDDEDTIHIVDILSGRLSGACRGPGRPIGATTQSEGIAVLFESGDLFQLDRDGQLLDRSRPPGRALQLVDGHPLVPGPIVLTTEGLFAYGEVRTGALRDVDGLIALAELLQAEGRSEEALRLATFVAVASAGRVSKAELLRASLLRTSDNEAAAVRAQQRAEQARDLTQPLPYFGR